MRVGQWDDPPSTAPLSVLCPLPNAACSCMKPSAQPMGCAGGPWLWVNLALARFDPHDLLLARQSRGCSPIRPTRAHACSHWLATPAAAPTAAGHATGRPSRPTNACTHARTHVPFTPHLFPRAWRGI